MNVLSMIFVVLAISDSMIGKSPLPDFLRPEMNSELIGISALYQLNRAFQGNFWCRREKQMRVFRHKNEGVQLIFPLASIRVESL
jgi:hypothetical protein